MNLRKPHRIVALIIFCPLLLVASSGCILLLRNRLEWVQPKTVASDLVPGSMLTPERVLEVAGPGVEQIIYRPGKNNISVRLKGDIENQYHAQTGALLKSAPRNSNFIIRLHEGSWLGIFGQNILYLLTRLGLLFLLFSGILIWPLNRKRNLYARFISLWSRS